MSRTTTRLRQPTFGRPTQQTGQNNRKPFNRPSKPEPLKPKPKPKPSSNNKKPAQQTRGRPSPRPQRPNPKPQRPSPKPKPRSARINKPTVKPTVVRPTTKPLSDGLTNQTGQRIGRRVIQNTSGRRAVGKIVGGASVVGKIQNAWDLGTGIGGLGRGLLGFDEINPYGDMPGFGAAELAWGLGDAINDVIGSLINPLPPSTPDARQVGSTEVDLFNITPEDSAKAIGLNPPFNDTVTETVSSTGSQTFPQTKWGTHLYYLNVTQGSQNFWQSRTVHQYTLPSMQHLNKNELSEGTDPSRNYYRHARVLTRITDLQGIKVSWTTLSDETGRSHTVFWSFIARKVEFFYEGAKDWFLAYDSTRPDHINFQAYSGAFASSSYYTWRGFGIANKGTIFEFKYNISGYGWTIGTATVYLTDLNDNLVK